MKQGRVMLENSC